MNEEKEDTSVDVKEKKISKTSPNIKYVGKSRIVNKKTGVLELVSSPPERIPTLRFDGMKRFDLPDGKTQLAGFYHEQAMDLIKAWPKDFKPIIEKGGKK